MSVQDIRFCQHFVEHGNAVEAYKQAKYHNSGAAYHTVGKAASLLVKKGKIRLYLRELKREAADVARLSASKVMQGLGRQAFADRRGVFGPDGEMLPPHLWPVELGSLIAGLDVEDLEEWDDVKKCKVKIGNKWKVRFERSGEAKRILAEVFGLVKGEAEGQEKTEPATDAERVAMILKLFQDAQEGEGK